MYETVRLMLYMVRAAAKFRCINPKKNFGGLADSVRTRANTNSLKSTGAPAKMKPRVSRRRTTTGRLGPEQTIEFAAHYSVTFAGSVLQAFAIADRDVSAPVFDQARALQTTRDDGHAGASRAQHLRKEFVRKFELVPFHTIMGHEHK